MHDELRYRPDPMVEKVILDVAQFNDTALTSCHGAGKTTAEAVTLITAMNLVPQLLVVQISPTWSQVKGTFWNELRKWFPNSRINNALFEIADKSPKITSRVAPEIWYAEGKATNSPGKIEGKHNKRVFIIVDEAKAVEDDIMQAVEGAMTGQISWRLYGSTPSTPGGKFTKFYSCFTKQREFWKTHKITALESPRVSKKWVAMMDREYGKESQVYRARVMAEFPDASGNSLLSLIQCEQFFKDPKDDPKLALENLKGVVSVGVDVGRFGKDESVISVWKGFTHISTQVFEKKSVPQVVKLADKAREDYGARIIVVDDIGIGGGVTDGLREKDYPRCSVVPFIASRDEDNTPPNRKRKPLFKKQKKYKNLKSAVYSQFATAVKAEQCVSIVKDDKLLYQMASYVVEYGAAELINVMYPESKKDRASEKPSPDRADSLIYGWWGQVMLARSGVDEDEPGIDRTKEIETDEDDIDERPEVESDNDLDVSDLEDLMTKKL